MEEKWETKHTLLIRAKDPNDQEAWTEFVDYYDNFIRMVLYQMNLGISDIDDLVQHILIEIWKSLPTYIYNKDRALFRTWLGQLIRNKAINHVTSIRRRNRKHDEVAKEKNNANMKFVSESEIDNIVHDEWKNHILRLALNKITPLFSERAIEVFIMSIDGHSISDIAKKYDIKPNTATNLKKRVSTRLKEEINYLKSELEPF